MFYSGLASLQQSGINVYLLKLTIFYIYIIVLLYLCVMVPCRAYVAYLKISTHIYGADASYIAFSDHNSLLCHDGREGKVCAWAGTYLIIAYYLAQIHMNIICNPGATNVVVNLRYAIFVTSILLMSSTLTSPALAQRPAALERNLPPAVQTPRADLTPQRITPSEDTTPLGVNLKGIRVFGFKGQVVSSPRGGVSIDDIEGVPNEVIEAALRPFLSQPLSQQLIAQSRAAVVEAYRGEGHPFVSVTAPPQEITSGVLQLQVVPYRLGELKSGDASVNGKTPHVAAIRAERGELIDASLLSEDIDWLNRFPYRQINGVFEPGSQPGETDLTLKISRQKPWRVYGGYANTGSQTTGYDRIFAGFAAGFEGLNDTTVSYQLTGSSDFWEAPSKVWLSGHRWPRYLSHAGRIVIPTFYRQGIEIVPNFVATRQETIDKVLSFRNTTFELPILYRFALSNVWKKAPSQTEVYLGPAMKWTERHTASDIINLARGDAATFNMILGASRYWQDATGATNALDVRVVANPGGVLPGNRGRIWNIQSNGRVDSVHYVYGLMQFDRNTPLNVIPVLKDFSLSTSLTSLISGQALPDTEQLALGGAAAVRAYSSNDASVDAGIIMRNELRLPTFSLLNAFRSAQEGDQSVSVSSVDSMSPYLFLDLAYGHNFTNRIYAASTFLSSDTTLIGAGAGFDYRVSSNLQASLSGGWALKHGVTTDRGDFTLNVRVTMSY